MEVPFFDTEKMPASEARPEGELPQDVDMEKWLNSIKELIVTHSARNGCVISCSVLKKEDRLMLAEDIDHQLDWVFISGSYEYVAQRVENIKGHDRPASLLKADFETLEIPKRALTVGITYSKSEIVDTILKYLARKYG